MTIGDDIVAGLYEAVEYMESRMKNVLVLGGTGFIGKNLQRIKPEWTYIGSQYGDLRNLSNVKKMVTPEWDCVINLAGNVGGIIHNANNNLQSMKDNFAVGVNVIEVAMEHEIPKVVTALSTCTFPNTVKSYPMTSEDMFKGKPPKTNAGYSMAKRCVQIANDIAREQGFNYVTFAPTNIYGPYDNFDPSSSHFVPAVIRKALEAADEIELYGTGNPLRQQMFVFDLVQLIPRIVEEYNENECLLVAPPENLSIDEMAKIVVENVNKNIKISYNGKYDGQFRKDVTTKMVEELFPEFVFTPFEQGVKATIQWYKDELSR